MSPPEAPHGHHGPNKYTNSSLVEFILRLSLLIILIHLVFPGILASYLNGTLFEGISAVEFLWQNRIIIAIILISNFIMTIIHEYIHAFVASRLGYKPEYGFRIHWNFKVIPVLNPYVITYDEYISRMENVLFLISPLLVIDILVLIGWHFPMMPSLGVLLCKVVLVLNTSSSAQDIQNVAKVALSTSGTLFRNYDSNGEVKTVYYPPEF